MKVKKLSFILKLLLMISIVFSPSLLNAKSLEVGKTYYGFKLIKEKKIKEYQAVGKLFIHLKSGARLLKVETDDDNKTFIISFKTPPESDGGMAHICEHSVLNGSKNFPVKSPFDILMKGSLKTFLNAMTGSDRTMYPVSSRNNKDYMNLMHVYLDAVFFPRIYKEPKIFQQEGWHYELDNKDEEIKYNGVVYNEMKGAFSSPSRELFYVISKNLFPDNSYGFESGGYPREIPKLSYKQFLSFHKRYYHPSNSYILIYGDYDVLAELKFINEEYLSKFNKIKVDSFIPLQKSFKKMKEVIATYPITKNGKDKDQTFLNLSFVTGLNTNKELSLAMDILSSALVDLPSSPIRRALQDAGIGRNISAYIDDSKQTSFSITVMNANPTDKAKFKEVVFNTLKKVVKKGLDKRVVEGLINRMEFRLREGKGAYKGLMLGMNSLNGWMFADDPFLSLEYEKSIKTLKSTLKTKYLENIIEKHLINNPHSLLTVLKPQKGLLEENMEKTKKELADYKATLSAEGIEALIKNTKELKKYQKTPDTPENLKKIPLLSLKDIDPRTDFYKITKKEINGINFLTYPAFSNNIVYTNLLFDTSIIPQELIPYVKLLSQVLGLLNTKNYSYGDLDTEINIHTGGINTYLTTYLKGQDTKQLIPRLIVQGKVMNYKVENFIKLCGEIIKNTKYDDPKRLKEVLTRLQSQLEASVQRNGFGVAMTRLSSYFSNAGRYSELTRGLTYYKFITDITNNFDKNLKEVITKLKKVANLLFNRSNLEIAVTASKNDVSKLYKKSDLILSFLGNKRVKSHKYKFSFDKKNEGITSSSKVQYVLQGFNFKYLGYKYSGIMAVLNQILSTDYLQKQIRVLGGAYGGFSRFSKDGTVYFASYRDPNLKKTLENYKKSVDYLKDFQVDERAMVRFIIGTLSKYERPLTAQQKGNSALKNYYESIKAEDVLRERSEILGTTPKDIRAMYKMVSDILDKNYYCVFGNEKKLNDAKEIFTKLEKAKY